LNPIRFGIKLLFLLSSISIPCFAAIETQTAMTPSMLLQQAIQEEKPEEVARLIENGVNLNEPFNDGLTALHTAVIHEQEDIVETLIEAGAKVNAMDASAHVTPLHLAALYGREKIAARLIAKGANVNAQMKFGLTPLLVAAQFGQVRMITLLLDKKAAVNHADQEGFTALHFAAKNGDPILVSLLLARGANPNLKDKVEATPLKIATENRHPEVQKVLEDHDQQ
jgi:ankyrin repeat protein